MSNVYPVLTPMAVDSSRPFPLIRNKSLNIGAIVHKKDDPEKEIWLRFGGAVGGGYSLPVRPAMGMEVLRTARMA